MHVSYPCGAVSSLCIVVTSTLNQKLAFTGKLCENIENRPQEEFPLYTNIYNNHRKSKYSYTLFTKRIY